MKNLISIISITLIISAPIAMANSSQKSIKLIDPQLKTKALQTESSVNAEIILAQNVISKVSSSELWKSLDINKDDSISKSEAIYSQEVSENWDKLDINKDEKINFTEFSQLFSEEN